jgi:hypothetical protein
MLGFSCGVPFTDNHALMSVNEAVELVALHIQNMSTCNLHQSVTSFGGGLAFSKAHENCALQVV